jgi:hypothetical protein
VHWLNREDQNRCAYEQGPFQGKFRETLRADQLGFCEALKFPSQAELINGEINRFNVSGIQSAKRTIDSMVVPIPCWNEILKSRNRGIMRA